MSWITTCLRGWLPLLALLAFGACQRASYSFQAPTSALPVASTSLPDAITGAPAVVLSSAASTIRQPASPPRRQHRSVGARRVPKSLARLQQLPLLGKQLVALPRATSRLAARQEPAPGASPSHWRTKGIALLLALFLGGTGAHLFYLGYYGRGAAYLAATVAGFLLLVVAVIGSIATLYSGGTGFMGLAIAGVILSSIVGLLGLIDIIRIITDDLKPKNGEYFPRFFQTRDAPQQPTR